MNKELYTEYLRILHAELVPAMGCTEPIAIALTAAHAASYLDEPVKAVDVCVSGNIIKNVKSVMVPNTGGLRGIEAATAAGIVAGDPARELEVLAAITADKQPIIAAFLKEVPITVTEAQSAYILDIGITLTSEHHSVYARTAEHHTGLCLITADGETVLEREIVQAVGDTDRSMLSIADILDFADHADLADVRELLDRQITCNTAIAEEGLTGKYGAAIGRTLLMSYGNTVHNRAKAWAAAGSDARMNGCELPVIINSGSGNQGMTASLPVIVYAREMGVSDELLYRALLVSNLTTIHLKTGIGCLSAYCGAISAGCGAAAGVMYLHGGGFNEIAHTVVNALAINSGVVCDGAKASCAAKIASAVESGLLGMQMYMHGKEFYRGDGIVAGDVEDTIRNVGSLAQNGMAQTDRELIRIMLEN
ncbi:MAG: serine dehydratase subunit alpha family protein [Ruminococcaceae bacterium]|nr:serine dehydratase subunit alpha family protein [Oscillospiraceae bacterium]